MGIWIRGQNKEVLIKASDIWTDGIKCLSTSRATEEEASFIIGEYLSPEEAIKALDMMQKHIYETWCVAPEQRIYQNPVFQMPPAGFSKPACPLDLTRPENYPCSRGDCDCDVCKDTHNDDRR